jgi:hypothetical protein
MTSPTHRWFGPLTAETWCDVVLPKEHGSWSLAFEPVALGLLAAPSRGGGWLAVAVAAGFFARRPLRLAWRDEDPARRATARTALAVCVTTSLAAAGLALATAGPQWLPWLLPTVVAGTVFVVFDLRNDARAALAEVSGVTAFGLLPAVFAHLAGWSGSHALALALLMLGRSVPTVLCVRACLRAAKTGERRTGPALLAAGLALTTGYALARAQLLPGTALVLLAMLAVRSGVLLIYPRPKLRARTLGLIEAILGLAFVVGASATA